MVHKGVYIDRHSVRMSSKPLEPLDEVYHENWSIYTLLMVLMGPCSDYHWYSWCFYTYYLGQNSAEVIVVILVTGNFGDGCKRQKVFMTVFDFGAKCDHFCNQYRYNFGENVTRNPIQSTIVKKVSPTFKSPKWIIRLNNGLGHFRIKVSGPNNQ